MHRGKALGAWLPLWVLDPPLSKDVTWREWPATQ